MLSRFKPFVLVSLSCLIFFISLYAVSQLDYRAILFVRSLNDPVIQQLGNVGNHLGDGVTLVLLSLGFLLVGYVWKKDSFRQAGIDSLVAHAMAGIAVQIPKHLIGRPRPRFTHQDAFDYGPSFQGGLDAFPSGHSAASFAVAAVLARYFPKMSWLWYGAASFVGLSRFLRGSHFPTDVLAGAVLGYLVGYVCARSYKEWRRSIYQAIPPGLPLFVGGLALFWITFRQPLSGGWAVVMDWVGLVMLFGGIAVRWNVVWKNLYSSVSSKGVMFQGLLCMGLGLALTTHSILVVLLAGFAGVVWWIQFRGERETSIQPSMSREIFQSVFFVGAMIALRGLNGLIPLQ
jgi:membrane-associated phospholipid phosphatase